MSRPRTPSFGAQQRSRLARRAATARWARLGRGVLTLAQIRDAVTKAIAERETKAAAGGAGVPRGLTFLPAPPAPAEHVAEAPEKHKPKAYLFGSYARGDAHARSNINILIVVERLPEDWLREVANLSESMHIRLDYKKEIEIVLVDEAMFSGGTSEACCRVSREGVRLA